MRSLALEQTNPVCIFDHDSIIRTGAQVQLDFQRGCISGLMAVPVAK